MGLHGSNTAALVFEDVEVPVEQRLGDEGHGFHLAMSALDGGRIGIASQALGVARAALEDSVRYAKAARGVRQAHRRATRPSSGCSPT